jgi:hypothetical protein
LITLNKRQSVRHKLWKAAAAICTLRLINPLQHNLLTYLI